jgi:hypothetical protein
MVMGKVKLLHKKYVNWFIYCIEDQIIIWKDADYNDLLLGSTNLAVVQGNMIIEETS